MLLHKNITKNDRKKQYNKKNYISKKQKYKKQYERESPHISNSSEAAGRSVDITARSFGGITNVAIQCWVLSHADAVE